MARFLRHDINNIYDMQALLCTCVVVFFYLLNLAGASDMFIVTILKLSNSWITVLCFFFLFGD